MIIPFINLKESFFFPSEKHIFTAETERDKIAVEIALMSPNKEIALFTLKKNINEGKEKKDFYNIGSYGIILRSIPDPSGQNKKIVEILVEKKCNLINVFPHENNLLLYTQADILSLGHDQGFTNENEIFDAMDSISSEIKKIGEIIQNKKMQNFDSLKNGVNVYEFIKLVIKVFEIPFEVAYDIFILNDVMEMLESIFAELSREIEGYEIDKEIDDELRSTLDKQQREFILREKIKIIRKKLGDDENDTEEEFIEKIKVLPLSESMPKEVQKLILSEKRRLKGMMTTSPEANISKTYIDLLQNLPWRKVKLDNLNIKKAKAELNKNHFGLKEIKERIFEFLAILIEKEKLEKTSSVKNIIPLDSNSEIDKSLFSGKNKKNNESNTNPIITLVGPPGTGKTSLAKSIANALGREFVKISLGGVKDESEIRGHRRTYIGAMPGKIIQAIKKSKFSNPLILLDEIDKMSSDYKGDPTSAMLEVLDPEQNKHFQDHYLEVEYDLSKVIFIATANYIDAIPEALLDRVEVIELSSYTILEKVEIARKHLIEATLKLNLLDEKFFQISDENLEYIIEHYTREAGVRELKRVLDKLARKITLQKIENKIKTDNYEIDKKSIVKFLGIEKFIENVNENQAQIGIVNGLAYTAYGGSTLPIEVTVFQGKGELKLTGQLREVMQESAQIALTYVRSKQKEFKIKDIDWDSIQIHIHVPEGAVPKDGPSAGITFATSIISALTNKPVPHNIGMTGEITLRGKVLPIGGLKEKTLAAYKFGINKVFLPIDNKRNIKELSKEVTDNIKFIPVSNYEEVFNKIFKV